MTQQSLANAHSVHPHPHQDPHSHPHPATPSRHPSPRRLGRLIFWEWTVVLLLLSGFGITLLAISQVPDSRRQADTLVAQMKAALAGKSPGVSLFGAYPVVSGAGREVTISHVPPKVCVLASWDLYRLGTIAINGVMPQRVSAARLVELCNDEQTATITWSPKSAAEPH